jgi:hypothetical protein
VASDAFVVLDADEFAADSSLMVPGFSRTFVISEDKLGGDDDPGFEWWQGLPRIDTVYVEHPVRTDVLIPVAAFHRLTFEDKVCEAIELAAALGARRIEAEHLSGWGREMAATFGLPRAKVEAKDSRSSEERFLFAATYEPSWQPPAEDDADEFVQELFEDHPWLAYERTWQAMAEGRVFGSLKSYSLLVTYESDHDIDASLDAGLRQIGLSAGGRFQTFERTSWRFDVTF